MPILENYLSFMMRSTENPHFVFECRCTRHFNFSIGFVCEAYVIINHALIIFAIIWNWKVRDVLNGQNEPKMDRMEQMDHMDQMNWMDQMDQSCRFE